MSHHPSAGPPPVNSTLLALPLPSQPTALELPRPPGPPLTPTRKQRGPVGYPVLLVKRFLWRAAMVFSNTEK